MLATVRAERHNFYGNREVGVLLSHPHFRKAARNYMEAGSTKALAEIPPCAVAIDINSQCNYRCRYCIDAETVNQPYLPTEMPGPLLRSRLSVLAEMGVRSAEIYGGEPMLHSEFGLLLSHAVRLGLALKIVSNGSRAHLFVPELAAAARIPGSSVRFSVNGDLETYGTATGVPDSCGAFRRVVRNIELLAKEGVPLLVSHVLFRENQESLFSTAKTVKESGARRLLVLMGRDPKTKQYLMRIDDALAAELKKVRRLGAPGFEVILPATLTEADEPQVKDYTRCAVSFLKPTICVNGNLAVCTYHKQRADTVLGRISGVTPLHKAWTSELRVKRALSINPARDCSEVHCTRHHLNRFLEAGDTGLLEAAAGPPEGHGELFF
jgi:MoaA/NifB/PqqE/SkfB family radical SAM enzyme